jgi:ADP-L-glycero-D-manno-heptose 6-epimerase
MDMSLKKIVVTGGAGFIGSNIVKHLNKVGITNIIIVDDLANNQDKIRNIKNLNFDSLVGIKAFIEDLDNFKTLDYIFHQGACSDTMNYDESYMFSNNTDYSIKLLNHSLNNNINFIFASSASIYGHGHMGFKEEKNCEMPLNTYAQSKLKVDLAIRGFLTQKLSSQVVSLRYFNVYGFPEFHKKRMASVPFHFFNQLKSNNTIKIFDGSKKFARDFIFIDDVLSIISHFIDSKFSGIYNTGTGNVRTFEEMAKITSELYPNTEIQTIPFPEKLRKYYQENTKANISNLLEAGYQKSFIKLEMGLKKYYNQLEKC